MQVSQKSESKNFLADNGLKKLCGVHPTVESDSVVCIIPQSITYQMSVLIRSFTNTISLWCLKILICNWYCKSYIVQGIFFTSEVFWKTESKGVESTKTQKTDIFESVWLRGVHPTSELSSTVCTTPPSPSQGHKMSQKTLQCASHRRVKLHTVEWKSKSLRASGLF